MGVMSPGIQRVEYEQPARMYVRCNVEIKKRISTVYRNGPHSVKFKKDSAAGETARRLVENAVAASLTRFIYSLIAGF